MTRLRHDWGYNTIGFLAPHNAYSWSGQLGQQVPEFKAMVRALHELRGIDNAAYYRLTEADRRYYRDTTGTWNSLNVRHPHALQLIMDSLRYWVPSQPRSAVAQPRPAAFSTVAAMTR